MDILETLLIRLHVQGAKGISRSASNAMSGLRLAKTLDGDEICDLEKW